MSMFLQELQVLLFFSVHLFLRQVRSSFKDILVYDNVTRVWQREWKEYYVIYHTDAGLRRLEVMKESIRYFCWVPSENRADFEVDAIPLTSSIVLDIFPGTSDGLYEENDSFMDMIANRQANILVLAEYRVPFAGQNFVIARWESKNVTIIAWRVDSRTTVNHEVSLLKYVIVIKKNHINLGNFEKNGQEMYVGFKQSNKSTHTTKNLYGEDVRLLSLSDGRLIAYWCIHSVESNRYHRIWVEYSDVIFQSSSSQIFIETPVRMLTTSHEKTLMQNKNYIMFEFGINGNKGQILFAVSFQPLRVVIPYARNNAKDCNIDMSKSAAQNTACIYSAHTVSLSGITNFCWNFGKVRGGTPAVRIGNHYIGFFHSSTYVHARNVKTYFIGAYMFSAEPPFRVTAMSKFPIVGRNFSVGWTYKGLDFDIFPMTFGAVKSDASGPILFSNSKIEIDPDFIDIVYGKNEREGWMLRLNYSELLRSLRPVISVVLGNSDWDQNGVPNINSFEYIATNESSRICGGPCETA